MATKNLSLIRNFIYGINPILQCLKANKRKIFSLFIEQKTKERIEEIISCAKHQNIPIYYIKKEIFYKYFDKFHHQGVVLECGNLPTFSLSEIIENNNFFVGLDHVVDPQNLGSIIRTLVFFGIESFIITKHNSAPLNAVVSKVSSGGLEHSTPCISNLNYCIDTARKKGFQIIGADMNGIDYTQHNTAQKTLLILGNEATGIQKLTQKKCDFLVKIPSNGKISSLNVSNAAAILIQHFINVS